MTLSRIFLTSGRVLDGQPVGELHEHLGRAGLGAVQASHEVIDRLRGVEDAGRLGLGEPARIGEAGQGAAVRLQRTDVRLARDEHHQALATFVGAPDLEHLHPWGLRGQGAVVAVEVLGVGQGLGLTHVVAEHVMGRGHRATLGQVIHERAQELGLGRPFPHRLCEVRVHGLRRFGRGQGGNEQEGSG